MGDYEKAYTAWKELEDELGRRELTVDKELPLQLAKNCKNKRF